MRTTENFSLFLVLLTTLWEDANSRPATVMIGDLPNEDDPLSAASSAGTVFPDYGSGSTETDSDMGHIDLTGEAKDDESNSELSATGETTEQPHRVRRGASLVGKHGPHCRRHGTLGLYDRFRRKAKPSQARRKARAPSGFYKNRGHPVVVQIKKDKNCRSRQCSMAYFLRKVRAYGQWNKNLRQTKSRVPAKQDMSFIDWGTLEAMP